MVNHVKIPTTPIIYIKIKLLKNKRNKVTVDV